MRVRVERKERAGHASQQRHHHEPMRWERRLLVLSVYCIGGMAVAFAFPCAARLHAHRVTAVHTCCRQSVQRSTHARCVFFFLPTAPSPSPSPCWRCTTRCCGEAKRHHRRLYHGWSARVATCALLARLPAQRCACGSQYCHYLIPRGHQSKHAQH